MVPIEYDLQQGAELDEGMRLGTTIELPFDAPPIWVVNGDPRLKSMAQVAPALYFGGWSSNFEEMQQICDDYKLEKFPTGFVQAETTSRDNKPLKIVVSRSVVVVPFGIRKSWITKDKQRYTQYVPGSRQHVQVLAILASKNGKIVPAFPVLLSAKGWQASHLEKSLSSFSSKTQPIRRTLAPEGTKEIPSNLFWQAIGTWGAEPYIVSVGQAQQQSNITPISSYLPKDIDEKQVKALFVGGDVINDMLDLKHDAADWLNAWSNLNGNTPGSAPAAIPPEEPSFNEDMDLPF